MKNKLFKATGVLLMYTALTISAPSQAMASPVDFGPGFQTSTSLVVKVDAMSPSLHQSADAESQVVGKAAMGSTYDVLDSAGDGWVRISNGEVEGYLNTAKVATVAETTEEIRDVSATRRQQVADFGKQFVGYRYVYGGTNPYTGVDCSGFTSYVLRNAAGVSLPHSSVSQASCGRAVTSSQMRPGDLVFYSQGRKINHVALYIGNGQVVHASNKKDGIKISKWNYRTPVKIVNVLGD